MQAPVDALVQRVWWRPVVAATGGHSDATSARDGAPTGCRGRVARPYVRTIAMLTVARQEGGVGA